MRPFAEAEAILQQTPFRARFHLQPDDLRYLRTRGGSIVREHAVRFIRDRLAPASPLNDGRQTPWRGHPVFVAQHATATCCRDCLSKVHLIDRNRPLTEAEQHHCVELIMRWLKREYLQSDNSA
jgi:hypothetical protein